MAPKRRKATNLTDHWPKRKRASMPAGQNKKKASDPAGAPSAATGTSKAVSRGGARGAEAEAVTFTPTLELTEQQRAAAENRQTPCGSGRQIFYPRTARTHLGSRHSEAILGVVPHNVLEASAAAVLLRRLALKTETCHLCRCWDWQDHHASGKSAAYAGPTGTPMNLCSDRALH